MCLGVLIITMAGCLLCARSCGVPDWGGYRKDVFADEETETEGFYL